MPEKENDADDILKMMIKPYVKAAYTQGRADERAAVVAWLRGKAHDPTWLRAHGVQSRQGVDTLEEAAECIERGEHVDAGKGEP